MSIYLSSKSLEHSPSTRTSASSFNASHAALASWTCWDDLQNSEANQNWIDMLKEHQKKLQGLKTQEPFSSCFYNWEIRIASLINDIMDLLFYDAKTLTLDPRIMMPQNYTLKPLMRSRETIGSPLTMWYWISMVYRIHENIDFC